MTLHDIIELGWFVFNPKTVLTAEQLSKGVVVGQIDSEPVKLIRMNDIDIYYMFDGAAYVIINDIPEKGYQKVHRVWNETRTAAVTALLIFLINVLDKKLVIESVEDLTPFSEDWLTNIANINQIKVTDDNHKVLTADAFDRTKIDFGEEDMQSSVFLENINITLAASERNEARPFMQTLYFYKP